MKTIFLKQILTILLIVIITSTAHALDVRTHKTINEHIAQHTINGFSLGNYITNQLGFTNGIYEKFNSKGMAWEWLRDGGEYEDSPEPVK